ncbi:MAG TPA: hypothetical protein VHQ88_12700, partial [Burkholderiales bacterium]|nr:hypothetical protein [Burkholderiales bacterium]
MRAATIAACALGCPAALGASPLDFDFNPGGNAAGHPVYDDKQGFGFEPGGTQRFSVRVPEGSYAVTFRFADSRKRSKVSVLAEQRRLMFEDVPVAKGTERTVVVNVRVPELAALPANATGGTRVALKPREIGSRNWDDKLTLEIRGDAA